MKKKIVSVFISFIIILNTCSFGIYTTVPVWSENEPTSQVNAEPAENFLNIESEAAILIEASTRKSSI